MSREKALFLAILFVALCTNINITYSDTYTPVVVGTEGKLNINNAISQLLYHNPVLNSLTNVKAADICTCGSRLHLLLFFFYKFFSGPIQCGHEALH